jgi:Holliday junction resolvase RusA-like endonuclease
MFDVRGLPKPAGSKRAFYIEKLKRSVIVEASKNKDWIGDVKGCALRAMHGKDKLEGPLELTIQFWMPRPKHHFGNNRKQGTYLKATSPTFHESKPDSTKLLRCIEDALTGIVWKDDCQVARTIVEKIYSETPGARVKIITLSQTQELLYV